MFSKNIFFVVSVLFTFCGVQLTEAKKLIGPLLLKLEKDIHRMIEEPEEPFSDRLILDLLYYCRSLIRLNYMIDNRSESAKEIAKYLFNEGGPSFLEAQVDSDVLMSTLQWKEEDIKNLQFLFEKVKLLWIEFHKTYKRNIVCVTNCVKCEIPKEFADMHIADESIISNLRNSPENRDGIFAALEHIKYLLYKAYQIVFHHNRWLIDDATFVYKMGKPRILNETIDTPRLNKLFEWNIGHFTQLEYLISEIRELWTKFVNQYELLEKLYKL